MRTPEINKKKKNIWGKELNRKEKKNWNFQINEGSNILSVVLNIDIHWNDILKDVHKNEIVSLSFSFLLNLS